MLTKVMGLELGPHKVGGQIIGSKVDLNLLVQIRVNAVNPTVVMTAMGKKAWSDPTKAGVMLSRIPLGRFVGKWLYDDREHVKSCSHAHLFKDVDEVVKPILFLLSEQSAMVNCAILPIDGGFAAC